MEQTKMMKGSQDKAQLKGTQHIVCTLYRLKYDTKARQHIISVRSLSHQFIPKVDTQWTHSGSKLVSSPFKATVATFPS